MNLTPANASTIHAQHFIRLAQMAGDDIFTTLLGNRAAPALEAMFLREDNDFSFRHTTLLSDGAAIAGMLHGCSAREANDKRTSWLFLRHAGWQLPRLLAIGLMLGPILDFVGSNLDDDDFYISFLAIDPAYRGRGLSQILLEHARRLTLESRCTRLTLDVDERNHIAIGAYHKAGFVRVAASKRIRQGGDHWGLLRLAKTLKP